MIPDIVFAFVVLFTSVIALICAVYIFLMSRRNEIMNQQREVENNGNIQKTKTISSYSGGS